MSEPEDLNPAAVEDADPGGDLPTPESGADPDAGDVEVVTTPGGEQLVPLSALRAVRGQLKELRPQAQRVADLEREIAESRPYVEFLRNNPQVLHPAPAPAPSPLPSAEDTHADTYARRFDLYTAEGKPDLVRAKAILDDTRSLARQEAEKVLQPVQERTDMAQAAANLQWLTGLTDATGQKVNPQIVDEVIRSVTGGMPKAQALRVLADAKVMGVIADTVFGRQSRTQAKPAAVAAPGSIPLVSEPSGGGTVTMTDSERRHAKAIGRSEKDWQAASARFKPGQSNALED